MQAFFEKTFPDALPLMPTLHEDYRNNPTGSLMTVRCKPWQLGGRYALVGDAAHAVVPFYGQGMNAGFEDCRVLDECIEAHTPAGAAPTDTDWAAALEAYQTARVPDGNAIADLAISNFIEMRDLVRDDRFRLKKRIGARLHEIDEAFLPLYSMVTFSHIRYSLAQQLGREQEALLDKLAALSDIDDKLAAATPPRELTDALARWRELRAAAEA
ncbi:MAG: FAD-dependent monooxygenase [Myxococcales bacterium]|nr:FAD-dependent monooxygenase [Myxococcales bacterium]